MGFISKNKNYAIAFLLAFAVYLLFCSYPNYAKYLFYLRVPIISGLLLVFLPMVALYFLPSMLGNFFVLSNKFRIATVIPMAVWSGLGIAFVGRVIADNMAARFLQQCCNSVPPVNAGPIWPYIVGVLLAIPIILAVYWSSGPDSGEMTDAERKQGSMWGGAIALALIGSVYYLDHHDASIIDAQALVKALLSVIGYCGSKDGFLVDDQLTSGHIQVFWFMLVGAVLYWAAWFFYRPRSNPTKSWQQYQAPILFYLLEIILILNLTFSFLTFWLDYFLAPVLLLFVVGSIVAYKLWQVEHDYNLVKSSSTPSADFVPALQQRLAKQAGKDKTLVVVCASGGGIQAAGWTAQVLAGLQAELNRPVGKIKAAHKIGEKFTQAIGLISSVSGGSVGALHFMDRIDPATGAPDDSELANIFYAATAESLSAAGWGLAYPDLWRFFGLPPIFKTTPRDRGAAIDLVWQNHMRNGDASLDNWAAAILQGQVPSTVFNSTLVEDGRRYLVCPMDFGMGADTLGGVDFKSLFPKADLKASTAALLSATFPYVSPIMRNSVLTAADPVFHVADGGFFDNYGVVTAVEWLEDKILPHSKDLNLKQVLLVRINAFPGTSALETGSKEPEGWKMAFLGPILTVLNARTSTQVQRNADEIEDLINLARDQHKVEVIDYNIAFPENIAFFEVPMPETKVKGIDNMLNQWHGKDSVQAKRYQPPLTWMLSKYQKDQIQQGWVTLLADKTNSLHDLLAKWRAINTPVK